MPKKPAAERKELRVSVRVTPQLKKRIESAEEITGLPESQVVVRSLEAFCDYVEQHGEFTVPFAVVPQSSLPPYLLSNSAPQAVEPGYSDYLRALKEAGGHAQNSPIKAMDQIVGRTQPASKP